jgi:hypothetical protein
MSSRMASISRTSSRKAVSNSDCERRSYQSRCMRASSTSVVAMASANPPDSSGPVRAAAMTSS